MNEFEELKNNWKEQSIQGPSASDFLELKKGIKTVARKQKITNVVLLTTVGVLVVFFFYVGAIDFHGVAFSIGTMIAALVIRVLLEFFSVAYLKNMTTTWSIQHFRGRLQKYYQNRIWVHLVLTPILLAIYSYAFWTLLPDFKVSLSQGFYTYIVYSSLVLLIVFVLFIGNEVHKELKVLKELKRD
ncbi:MAG: hypothetical protein AAGH81_09115 [Bacteroidota bacterium]